MQGLKPGAFHFYLYPVSSRIFKFACGAGGLSALITIAAFYLKIFHGLDNWIARGFGLDPAVQVSDAHQHPGLTLVLLPIVGLGVCWTTAVLKQHWIKVALGIVMLLEILGCSVICALWGFYFSPVLPIVTLLLSFSGGFAFSLTSVARRQWLVEDTFARRISSKTALTLLHNRALPAPGEIEQSKERELTILSCEMFNHEQLASLLSPTEFTQLMNLFLERASDVITQYGGYLLSCDGDGIRAVFGEPFVLDNHAVAACKSALEILELVPTIHPDLPEATAESFATTITPLAYCDVRVGVTTGLMLTGHFGLKHSDGQLESFGVVGEEMAFARRLCAANLVYGSKILMSARTYELAEKEMVVRPLELLKRRALDNWLEVYELLGEEQTFKKREKHKRDLFWSAVIYYREQKYLLALEKFQQVKEINSFQNITDAPLEFYIQRIEKLLEQGDINSNLETNLLQSFS